jgi:hypothetical protein
MADHPSIDEVLAAGRRRERKTEIVLGVIVIAGGLALRIAGESWDGDGRAGR